jgi:hypothetical protein
MTRLNRDAPVNDDPMCKHGRLLHQDCMACEDIAAALARDSTTAALIDSLSLQVGEHRAEIARLRAALSDMLSGWRYIRTHHGDLSGVGWGRCEDAASAALEPPA